MAEYTIDKIEYGSNVYKLQDNISGFLKAQLNYTTSGNNRKVQADANGNLYVVQQETDPVFSASAAAGITSSDINNWNAKVQIVTWSESN